LVEKFQENDLNILTDLRAPVHLSKNPESQQWYVFKKSQSHSEIKIDSVIVIIRQTNYLKPDTPVTAKTSVVFGNTLASDVTTAVTATEQTTVTPGVV
jgi:hypothetical protein